MIIYTFYKNNIIKSTNSLSTITTIVKNKYFLNNITFHTFDFNTLHEIVKITLQQQIDGVFSTTTFDLIFINNNINIFKQYRIQLANCFFYQYYNIFEDITSYVESTSNDINIYENYQGDITKITNSNTIYYIQNEDIQHHILHIPDDVHCIYIPYHLLENKKEIIQLTIDSDNSIESTNSSLVNRNNILNYNDIDLKTHTIITDLQFTDFQFTTYDKNIYTFGFENKIQIYKDEFFENNSIKYEYKIDQILGFFTLPNIILTDIKHIYGVIITSNLLLNNMKYSYNGINNNNNNKKLDIILKSKEYFDILRQSTSPDYDKFRFIYTNQNSISLTDNADEKGFEILSIVQKNKIYILEEIVDIETKFEVPNIKYNISLEPNTIVEIPMLYHDNLSKIYDISGLSYNIYHLQPDIPPNNLYIESNNKKYLFISPYSHYKINIVYPFQFKIFGATIKSTFFALDKSSEDHFKDIFQSFPTDIQCIFLNKIPNTTHDLNILYCTNPNIKDILLLYYISFNDIDYFITSISVNALTDPFYYKFNKKYNLYKNGITNIDYDLISKSITNTDETIEYIYGENNKNIIDIIN